jgi:GTP-binding protein LepA
MDTTELIRNFCIVAHIDHGKSTLADRFIEITGTLTRREMRDQVLDGMDLERERGITIKATPVTMLFTNGGKEYELNLIDTPGHVDFSYEVSRSLAACEGALLLVDSTQGIEAQTVANFNLSLEAGLDIIPVVNKIDLPTARPEEVAEEIINTFGFRHDDILFSSGKTGDGAREILDVVIKRIPAPKGVPAAPLRALVFDAMYDEYRGIIVHIRLVDGSIKNGDVIHMLGTGRTYEVTEVGRFVPKMFKESKLSAGEVGYFTAQIKALKDVAIGDTVTHYHREQTVKPLPGYKEPLPMVFSGIYPVENSEYPALKKALDKLSLNDSSFTYEPENSDALGFGFRCGFLGLLHMDIVQERLERESNVDIIQTAPTVNYEIVTTDGKTILIDSPAKLPDPTLIAEFREPLLSTSLIIPTESVGQIMQLCDDRRGKFIKQEYLSQKRVILIYHLPLAEIIFDFYDKLKSATHGYGTMDYQFIGYAGSDLVKLTILVGGQPVDALSMICHRGESESRGRAILRKLRKEIPRHLFEVALQAAIGGKIVARENIAPMRKNVLAKCYGGDVTRKRKLLERQKEGKKRMKFVGNVEIPQKAFLAVLSAEEDE